MTPLQELTKKIQSHCPELVELRFGCKLLRKSNDCPEYIIAEKPSEDSVELRCWDGWQKKQWVRENFEILGHPITLEHVLKAIAIQNSGELFDIQAFDGELIRITLPNWDTDSNWTLTKPLHLQSEPLINWLNTIIK